MPLCKRDRKANADGPRLEIVKATPANESTKDAANDWREPKQPQDKREAAAARSVDS